MIFIFDGECGKARWLLLKGHLRNGHSVGHAVPMKLFVYIPVKLIDDTG